MCKERDAGRQTSDARKAQAPNSQSLMGLASGVWRLASLALIASACAGITVGSPATVTTGAPTTTVVPSTTVQEPWVWGVDEQALRQGYLLGPCEGDANQIACIAQDGIVIGSAEYLALPVDSFESLEGVDDPVKSMEIIAGDYLSTFRADRESACPDLEFRELPPTPVTVGGQPGLRYGFDELDGARVVERNLIYGVRKADVIGLFNFSATTDSACLSNEGELDDPAILDSLLPTLDQVMAVVEPG